MKRWGTEIHGGRLAVFREETQVTSGIFIGLSTIDIVYAIEQFPAANTKLTAATQEVFVGGPATNAAITFRHLGGGASLVTGVGRHALGSLIGQELQRYSTSLLDLTPDFQGMPPVSSIWVNAAGERNVVSPSASRNAQPAGRVDQELLRRASILLIDGHFMEACRSWAQAAHEQGKTVVLDGGSWKPGTEELLRFVDTAICSADFRPPECSSDADVLRYLNARGVANIAISRGEQPILTLSAEGASTVPVPVVPLVDTMGAGDILHGAFCWFFSAGLPFLAALERAARVASESCRYRGTREWMRHGSGQSGEA